MAGRVFSLVLKVAERCNLNCSYCYMYQHEDKSYLARPKFMSDQVFSSMLLRVRDYCDRHAPHQMSLTLHGGEPTLVGTKRMDQMCAQAREVLGDRLRDIVLQTNAMFISEEWIEIIERHQIQVAVSLDGPAEVHDAVRVDHEGRGSYEQTVRGALLLEEAGLLNGVLCVIAPGQSGLEVYRHFRSLGIRHMNFLPPDVTHDSRERFFGTQATPVADYLIPIFDEWFSEDDPKIRISLFWSLITLMMGGETDIDLVGNSLMTYLVVETDGTIQAVDTLRICKEGLAESGLNVLTDGFDDLHRGLPLVHQLVHEGLPLSAICNDCVYKRVCGGGYIPHRYSRARGFDNPSVWCADIMKLLDHLYARTGIPTAVPA